jgi:hypothetical protein
MAWTQGVNQNNLPEYTGRFSYQPHQLQEHLKAEKSDYDYTDPKTWPVVTASHLKDCLGEPYKGYKLLPPFVAYERNLVETCVRHWPNLEIEIKQADSGITKRSLHFHHFPFVVDYRGRWRHLEFMLDVQYASWVAGVVGKKPEARIEGKEASTDPMDPFDEIMEIIRKEKPSFTPEEIKSLKRELAIAQSEANAAEKARIEADSAHEKELAQERRRTEAVVQSSKAIKRDLQEALREEKRLHAVAKSEHVSCLAQVVEVKARCADETKRANIAEKRVKERGGRYRKRGVELKEAENTLRAQAAELDTERRVALAARKELKVQAKELEAVMKEASSAKEQILKIREELMKAKGIGAQKRQADDGAPHSQSKKARAAH